MNVAIDCDGNGIELKRGLIEYFATKGIPLTDLAYREKHPEGDYPDVAFHLAGKILDGAYGRGILICGTGLGMEICANKIKGIYAGSCNDVYAAERLAKSNNAQIITLGAFVTGLRSAQKIVEAFLTSDFEGGQSTEKVKRLRELESLSYQSFRESTSAK